MKIHTFELRKKESIRELVTKEITKATKEIVALRQRGVEKNVLFINRVDN